LLLFCAHFWQIGKVSVLVCEQGNFPLSIKQRAERSFRNALLSGKTTPPEKFLPESPSILPFCGLYGVRGERPPAAFYEKVGYDFPKKWQ